MIFIMELDVNGHGIPQQLDNTDKLYFVMHGFTSLVEAANIPKNKLDEIVRCVLSKNVVDMIYMNIQIHEENDERFDELITLINHQKIQYQQLAIIAKISKHYYQVTHNIFPITKISKMINTLVRIDVFESNEEFVSYTSHNNEFTKSNIAIEKHVLFGKEPDGVMFFSLSNPIDNLREMIKERIEMEKKEISFLIVYHNLKLYSMFEVEHMLFANGIQKESIDILNGENITYIHIRDNGVIVEPVRESIDAII